MSKNNSRLAQSNACILNEGGDSLTMQ